MKVLHSPRRLGEDSTVALGSFDGLHLGHSALLDELVKQAGVAKRASVLLSFFPHPRKVLQPEVPFGEISDFRERSYLLRRAGVDVYYLMRFDHELSQMSPEHFVQSVLLERLGCKQLVAGSDAAFGHKRVGNLEWMRENFPKYGIELVEVPIQLIANGPKVASRDIRQFLESGEIEQATAALGHPFSLRGRVQRGERMGRKLDFPTANLHLRNQVQPKQGVYAGFALLAGKICPAVANYGVRPTFDGNHARLEVHLLGGEFPSDFYGQFLRFFFVKQLRAEQKFDGPEALKAQIAKDCERAKQVLSEKADLENQLRTALGF